MADPVKTNIMKTGAKLWFAPEGESLPDETTIGADDDWGGNWDRMGFTSAPLVMVYEDTRMGISPEEVLGDIEEWRTFEASRFETSLAELTADHFGLLTDATPQTTAAGAGQVGYEELDIGGNGRVEVFAVGFEGIRYDASDNSLPFRVFMPRATFKKNGNVEFSQKTDTYPNIPLMIKGLSDPDNSGRQLKIQRVTAPATS